MRALTTERVEQKLRERFSSVAIERQLGEAMRDHTLIVPAESLVEICSFLRDDSELEFAMLSWMGGADYMPRAPRFETIYNLLSLTQNLRDIYSAAPCMMKPLDTATRVDLDIASIGYGSDVNHTPRVYWRRVAGSIPQRHQSERNVQKIGDKKQTGKCCKQEGGREVHDIRSRNILDTSKATYVPSPQERGIVWENSEQDYLKPEVCKFPRHHGSAGALNLRKISWDSE